MFSKLAFNYYKLKLFNQLDKEMTQIPKLIKKQDVAIDIGANIGFYSYYCSKIFKNVHAFEPIKLISKDLNDFTIKNKSVSLHNYALSNSEEEKSISVPFIKNKNVLNYGYASLSNEFENKQELKISTKTLDSFNFCDVDFIKIDVEGHENQVIKGGINTIKKFMPLILIEIEKRHTDVKAIETINKLISLGYDCIFLNNGILEKYEKFNFKVHQNQNYIGTNKYICNFFFVPKKT